jgi:hypothetical protein
MGRLQRLRGHVMPRAKGDDEIMSRMKAILLALLAILAVSSVASATASAALQGGPWYRHPFGGSQVKWPMNEEQQIKGRNQGSFILKSTVAMVAVTLECKQANIAGNIWNGLRQGEGESEVKFSSCVMVTPCTGEAVTVEPSKVYSELMWSHAVEAKELEEVGQQKIYSTFAPTAAPVAGKAKFTTIKIPVKCIAGGTFNVEAAGKEAVFVNQHQESKAVVWGTAAETAPQNQDATAGYLIWRTPNETKLHHQGGEVEAKLKLGPEPAELQGYLKIERNILEEFGVFDV